ncbi:unnamed protein product [Mytilus edulis]|uniref:B box-type domain-containing protein n=1 Tax=Mytilus edulis TaxID=6550 RepID=A0A8S3SNW1_MYTED|nr:unnamed protein product [Mytilus edulis]
MKKKVDLGETLVRNMDVSLNLLNPNGNSNRLPCCGPCGFDDVTEKAKRWCTDCKEGLCENCEKAHIKNKISRNHKIISIEDYRKIENVSISEVFLGTYQGNKTVVTETKSIKNAIKSFKDYKLKLDLNSLIEKLSIEVQDFGQIKVIENSSQLYFRDTKIDQAQIGIVVPTSGNIFNIQLQLIKLFRISSNEEIVKMRIFSCIILPNGNALFATSVKNKLIEYSDAGNYIRKIPISTTPFGIALVDHCRIAVTFGSRNFLEIIDYDTFKVEKKISFPKVAGSISPERETVCRHWNRYNMYTSPGFIRETTGNIENSI